MDRKTWFVVVAVYGVTWGLMKLISVYSLQLKAMFYFALCGVMWTPMIIAYIAAKHEKFRIPFVKDLNGLWVIALLSAYLLGIYIGYCNPSDCLHDHLILRFAVLYPIFAILGYVIHLGGVIFWWGYFYKKLETIYPPIAILLIGLCWGLWYAPFILLCDGFYYDSHPEKGMIMMPLVTIVLSPIMFYFRRRGKNVVTPALFFGALLTTPGLILSSNKDDFIDGVIGIAGIKVMLVFSCLALALLWKEGAFKVAHFARSE